MSTWRTCFGCCRGEENKCWWSHYSWHCDCMFSHCFLERCWLLPQKTTWVLYDGSLKNFFNIHKDQRIFMTLEFNNNHHNWLMSCDYWWLLVFKPLNHWYRSTKTLAARASSVGHGLGLHPLVRGAPLCSGIPLYVPWHTRKEHEEWWMLVPQKRMEGDEKPYLWNPRDFSKIELLNGFSMVFVRRVTCDSWTVCQETTR